MTFREKIESELDNIDEGVFIGYLKSENGDHRQVVFIPHTHDVVSKLGLINYAKQIVEQDAFNQIGTKNLMLEKLFNSYMDKMLDSLNEMTNKFKR